MGSESGCPDSLRLQVALKFKLILENLKQDRDPGPGLSITCASDGAQVCGPGPGFASTVTELCCSPLPAAASRGEGTARVGATRSTKTPGLARHRDLRVRLQSNSRSGFRNSRPIEFQVRRRRSVLVFISQSGFPYFSLLYFGDDRFKTVQCGYATGNGSLQEACAFKLRRCVESGISGSIREHQESRSGMGVSGVPDIRESGPTGYPGYLRDIRDIRNQDQGWGYTSGSLPDLPDSTQLRRVY